jgi:hypothetical protein
MHRAGATPLIATLNGRLELQLLQHGLYRDLFPD